MCLAQRPQSSDAGEARTLTSAIVSVNINTSKDEIERVLNLDLNYVTIDVHYVVTDFH